ncbi:hypothetical protein [Sphingobacterium sp. IITKGP-BTPF85]|uniref:hypothetical protein n=1 Tax=Sphingobacterium sp. IITKGP-BTPF85 TaxID=1338009 RepID=UPI00038A0C9F|nr:hypothetical protein [Sphingobacterium sp. IITKGP-BTPF85]KKX50755.1 hypothetical protein L950_0208645 [Sphingobacterium sp. IITKGP-BTPF85]
MLKEERNGHLCKDKEFFKLCGFYFFILEETINEFDTRIDKKNLFDYYLSYCKFISDRKKLVELYKDGQNRDGKY